LPDKAASHVALLSSLVAVHSPSSISSYSGNLAALQGLLGKEPEGLFEGGYLASPKANEDIAIKESHLLG